MSKKILFQGDSVTDAGRSREAGLPDNQGLGAGYPMLVAARLNADEPGAGYVVLNRGISGNRVVDLYARWKCDTLNLKPDILSILIGINDTWHEKAWQNGVEPERYERILRELLSWTKNTLPSCRIVLCEPFCFQIGVVAEDWVPEMKERSRIVRKLAQEFQTLFLPLQTALDKAAEKSSPDLILGDGVHPRLAGHQIIADEWLKAVKAEGWL